MTGSDHHPLAPGAGAEASERETPRLCNYCGETSAWPRHICLVRLTKAMGPDPAPFPCSYSVEGDQRLAASLADASTTGTAR